MAAIRNGDVITIDLNQRSITLELSDAEIARRLEEWRADPAMPPRKVPAGYSGVLTKYAATAGMAHTGALVGARSASSDVPSKGTVTMAPGL
eukprot:SAG31_NODE_8377_length_1463_cov_2.163490_3_plen_92_part_00